MLDWSQGRVYLLHKARYFMNHKIACFIINYDKTVYQTDSDFSFLRRNGGWKKWSTFTVKKMSRQTWSHVVPENPLCSDTDTYWAWIIYYFIII